MLRSPMCFAFVTTVLASSAVAESVYFQEPSCFPGAHPNPGTRYSAAVDLVGEVLVAKGQTGDSFVVLLASCDTLRQLRVENIDGPDQQTDYYHQMISFVVDADDRSFDGLTSQYDADLLPISVGPIDHQLCTCLSERM